LTLAGERAASLAASGEAARYFEQAAELADDRLEAAALRARAGQSWTVAGRFEEARELLERALAVYQDAGETAESAHVAVALAEGDFQQSRLGEAVERLELAVAALDDSDPGPALAEAVGQLGRIRAVLGEVDAASVALDRASALAEAFQLDEVLSSALSSKGVVRIRQGRLVEARILLEAALERGRAAGTAIWWRAANNLGVVLESTDRYGEVVDLSDSMLADARRVGNRPREASSLTGALNSLFLLGRWDEALAVAAEADPLATAEFARAEMFTLIWIHCERGDLERAAALATSFEWMRETLNPEFRAHFLAGEARWLRAQGRPAEGLAAATRALEMRNELSLFAPQLKLAFAEALEAAMAAQDAGAIRDVLGIADALRPGEVAPFVAAHRNRFHAQLAAVENRPAAVEEGFTSAAATFREFGLAFHLALTLLEQAEWLAEQGRPAEASPLADEARELFERLGAKPWLERLAGLRFERELA
jgi:tetratricopeptide (TPR) repeat protein